MLLLLILLSLLSLSLADNKNMTSTTLQPTSMTQISISSLVPTETILVPQTTITECDPNQTGSCVPVTTVETSTTSILGTEILTLVSTPIASIDNGIPEGNNNIGIPESSTHRQFSPIQIISALVIAGTVFSFLII